MPEDNWQGNGCCPTSIATIVSWWAEDNLTTKGRVHIARGGANTPIPSGNRPPRPPPVPPPPPPVVPPPPPPETLEALSTPYKGYPLAVAYDLWRFDFDPVVTRTPPATATGLPTFDHDPFVPYESGGSYQGHPAWNVRYEAAFNSLGRLRWVVAEGAEPVRMQTLANGSGGGGPWPSHPPTAGGRIRPDALDPRARQRRYDAKRARLLSYLLRGPVMVNMNFPGHWVVVHGLEGGRIYIQDPGRVLETHWCVLDEERHMHAGERATFRASQREHPEWYQDPLFLRPPSAEGALNCDGADVDLDESFVFWVLDSERVYEDGEPVHPPNDWETIARAPPADTPAPGAHPPAPSRRVARYPRYFRRPLRWLESASNIWVAWFRGGRTLPPP